jgi:hypothetical protein
MRRQSIIVAAGLVAALAGAPAQGAAPPPQGQAPVAANVNQPKPVVSGIRRQNVGPGVATTLGTSVAWEIEVYNPLKSPAAVNIVLERDYVNPNGKAIMNPYMVGRAPIPAGGREWFGPVTDFKVGRDANGDPDLCAPVTYQAYLEQVDGGAVVDPSPTPASATLRCTWSGAKNVNPWSQLEPDRAEAERNGAVSIQTGTASFGALSCGAPVSWTATVSNRTGHTVSNIQVDASGQHVGAPLTIPNGGTVQIAGTTKWRGDQYLQLRGGQGERLSSTTPELFAQGPCTVQFGVAPMAVAR